MIVYRFGDSTNKKAHFIEGYKGVFLVYDTVIWQSGEIECTVYSETKHDSLKEVARFKGKLSINR